MTDYAGTEKVFYPATTLSTCERKTVSDPKIGDINVFAPWGNVVIFYKTYTGSRDLIRIGRITEGMDVFNVSVKINDVTIELIKQ